MSARAAAASRAPNHSRSDQTWEVLRARKERDGVRESLSQGQYPGHYIGLDALSGPTDAWFLDPYPSFAVAQQLREQQYTEPLNTELDAGLP
jgi:hypothetical protein